MATVLKEAYPFNTAIKGVGVVCRFCKTMWAVDRREDIHSWALWEDIGMRLPSNRSATGHPLLRVVCPICGSKSLLQYNTETGRFVQYTGGVEG